MDVPKYDELLNPTLNALHKLGGSASIDEITEEVATILNLPTAVLDVSHGSTGTTEIEYRLGWARTYLKKYGLIDNSERGVWALTTEGRKTKTVSPQELKRFVKAKRVRAPRKQKGAEVIQIAEDVSSTWQEDALDNIMQMTPDAFERLCQRLLRESGFIQVEVTGRSGDGGIDGHGIVKIAGLLSFPTIFQAKRYSGSVGAPEVRNFRGAMVGRADKGLLITTGSFTASAKAEATRDGAPPIDLIDGDQLVEKLKELTLGISTKMVEAVEVDSDWFQTI